MGCHPKKENTGVDDTTELFRRGTVGRRSFSPLSKSFFSSPSSFFQGMRPFLRPSGWISPCPDRRMFRDVISSTVPHSTLRQGARPPLLSKLFSSRAPPSSSVAARRPCFALDGLPPEEKKTQVPLAPRSCFGGARQEESNIDRQDIQNEEDNSIIYPSPNTDALFGDFCFGAAFSILPSHAERGAVILLTMAVYLVRLVL